MAELAKIRESWLLTHSQDAKMESLTELHSVGFRSSVHLFASNGEREGVGLAEDQEEDDDEYDGSETDIHEASLR